MLVLAPIMCIVSGVAISNILRTFLPNMSNDFSSNGSALNSNSSSSFHQKRHASNSKPIKSYGGPNFADPTYPFKSQVGVLKPAIFTYLISMC